MRTILQVRAELEQATSRKRRLSKELRTLMRQSKGLGAKKKGMGVRIGDRDEAATKARDFLDPGSFVRADGSEVCKGRDWLVRKGELRERSGGRCEYALPGVGWRCANAATIPAHIEPRHPRRDDSMSNLKHYCFEHDRLTEKQSWRRVRSAKLSTAPGKQEDGQQ